MVLTERQQTAAALTREIERMGAWVTSALPLAPDDGLRFTVLDENRDQVLEKLSSWNWSPTLCNNLPRVCSGGWKLGSGYIIFIEPDKQPIADNRIHGEFARAEKTSYEVEALERYLGWPPKEKRRR
jgi:hypothetical protein